MATITTDGLMVCNDCTMTIANGELGNGDEAADAVHAERLALYVTKQYGVPWHGLVLAGEHDPETGDILDAEDFSTRACDGCGSTLAGYRHPAAVVRTGETGTPLPHSAPADGGPAADRPRVWIGCLSCYNDGALVGDWFDAADADAVTTERLHAPAWHAGHISGPEYTETPEGLQVDGHEELWCMDTDNMPADREMSPAEAQAWADLLDELDAEHLHGAFAAYLSSNSITAPQDVTVSDFLDAYCGEYDNREDYAQQLADDLGFDPGNEWPACYIDWERAARDLFMDHSDEPAPGGGIYVFRTL